MAKHYSATKHIYTLNDEVSQYPHRRSAAKKRLAELRISGPVRWGPSRWGRSACTDVPCKGKIGPRVKIRQKSGKTSQNLAFQKNPGKVQNEWKNVFSPKSGDFLRKSGKIRRLFAKIRQHPATFCENPAKLLRPLLLRPLFPRP